MATKPASPSASASTSQQQQQQQQQAVSSPSASASSPSFQGSGASIGSFQAEYNNRWDQCWANGLTLSGTGLVIGSLVGLLFFRSTPTRTFAIGVGTGVGAGIAWAQCRQQFLSSQIRPTSNRFTMSPSSSSSAQTPAQLLASSGQCPVPHVHRDKQQS